MRRPKLALLAPLAFATLSLAPLGCAGFGALYPPRPAETPGEPVADPSPSRIVVHATVTSKGLGDALEQGVPRTGEGTYRALGKDRRYTWRREAIRLRFGQGRVGLELRVLANAELPVGSVDLPFDVTIRAEPVVTSQYVVKLQSVEVGVSSSDRVVKLADATAGVLERVKAELEERLVGFAYELRPLLGEAHARLARPIELPLGEARGCATLKLLGVEAAPTVLADGLEKDLAFIVAPSVTIPCVVEEPTPLPPLANVAALPTGPFTVVVPVAATYDELAKAMGLAFTDGKLFFSKDYPELYLEKPEVYAARDQLVLKLHLGGPVRKGGFSADLDGDLFLSGRPVVVDNELRIPDLEPTIETKNFLLALKAAFDGSSIREEARAALRLDLGARLAAVRSKLSKELSFGGGQGCLRAQVNKLEVTGLHVHGGYLRVYLSVTGSTALDVPCSSAP